MKASQDAERRPGPLQRDRQDEPCWSQTSSSQAETGLKGPSLDLCDRFHDSVLHDGEQREQKRKEYDRR